MIENPRENLSEVKRRKKMKIDKGCLRSLCFMLILFLYMIMEFIIICSPYVDRLFAFVASISITMLLCLYQLHYVNAEWRESNEKYRYSTELATSEDINRDVDKILDL